jgi:hypothetical protein
MTRRRSGSSIVDAAEQLLELRMLALHDPAAAVASLDTTAAPPGVPLALLRHELRILHAEALQRAGDRTAAMAASIDLVLATTLIRPVDMPRMIDVLGVATDVAVWAGAPAAVALAASYRTTFTYATPPDTRRVWLADALHAVAVYHHTSCQDGIDLLTEARRRAPADGPIAAAIRAGVTAMQHGCGRRLRRLPPDRPLPMPGGVLHPDALAPDLGYLTDRIVGHPAAHTCHPSRTQCAPHLESS